jgi:hypothetical protein
MEREAGCACPRRSGRTAASAAGRVGRAAIVASASMELPGRPRRANFCAYSFPKLCSAEFGDNPLKSLDMRLGFPSARLGFPSARLGFPSARLGFPSVRLGFPSVRLGFPSGWLGFPFVRLGNPSSHPRGAAAPWMALCSREKCLPRKSSSRRPDGASRDARRRTTATQRRSPTIPWIALPRSL